MISGLSKEGKSEEAYRLYDEMVEAGVPPNDAIYSSLVVSLYPASKTKEML